MIYEVPHTNGRVGLDVSLTGTMIGWTLGKAIQEHIDVYVSQTTFEEIQRSFPYLVSKEFASGGGDVRGAFLILLQLVNFHLPLSGS